jgi:flavin reductase (DIM6/NTAB) family NADH-FMN oxidoreductase RutF
VTAESETCNTQSAIPEAPSFRRAMSALAAGVTVVTTTDPAGRPCAFTATAVCLVSVEPPLLLACVGHQADCHEAFVRADVFAVNVLRDGQEALSRRCARKDPDKLAGVPCRRGALGAPVLPDVLAAVECRVTARHAAGDHTILIGRAEAWRATDDESACPLVYYRRQYHRLQRAGT